MRASYQQIAALADKALAWPGDVAELGVWRGDTFKPLARLAAARGRTAYAVDTFSGMPAASAHDIEPDGRCSYPQGCLNPGGSDALRHALADLGDAVCICEGSIPTVLFRLPLSVRFAFVHVDLDLYMPTLAALRWLWGRINARGIVCCHDWFEGQNYLAAGAIAFWMAESGVEPAGVLPSRHIWFVR